MKNLFFAFIFLIPILNSNAQTVKYRAKYDISIKTLDHKRYIGKFISVNDSTLRLNRRSTILFFAKPKKVDFNFYEIEKLLLVRRGIIPYTVIAGYIAGIYIGTALLVKVGTKDLGQFLLYAAIINPTLGATVGGLTGALIATKVNLENVSGIDFPEIKAKLLPYQAIKLN